MKIREIWEKVERDEYEISFHAEKERYAEDITIQFIYQKNQNGLVSGKGVEEAR